MGLGPARAVHLAAYISTLALFFSHSAQNPVINALNKAAIDRPVTCSHTYSSTLAHHAGYMEVYPCLNERSVYIIIVYPHSSHSLDTILVPRALSHIKAR